MDATRFWAICCPTISHSIEKLCSLHALNKLRLSWQFQCSSQKLRQQAEQSKTTHEKREKKKEREPTQWHFIHCIVKQKREREKRKKPSDSYFDIEHTFKIIVMGNLWLTCWLPIPLVLLASIPVCGEILSLGRRTTTIHSSLCVSASRSLLFVCLCKIVSMLFHSSSQRFQFFVWSFALPIFLFRSLFWFHSIHIFKCSTIVGRLSKQTIGKEADQSCCFFFCYYFIPMTSGIGFDLKLSRLWS